MGVGGREHIKGDRGHVIEDVEGGSKGNSQMGFLGANEKEADGFP